MLYRLVVQLCRIENSRGFIMLFNYCRSTVLGCCLLIICSLILSACDSEGDQQTSGAEQTSGIGVTSGVESGESAGDEVAMTEVAGATTITGASSERQSFTHKMMRDTGENRFASLAYDCAQCTFAQWLAIDPPEGWKKGPAQVTLFSRAEMRSTPSFEGVPDAVNFIDEVSGDEYRLIAKTLDAELIKVGPSGIVVEAQVMRDTIFFYDVGLRVHELTDPEGDVFVLFAYEVDPENIVIPDVQNPEFMDNFIPPDGWVYTSRVLEESLIIDTPDVATVLAIRAESTSTWQQR